MSWSWRYTGGQTPAVPEGAESPDGPGFPSQSDAETWLGENWRELRESGVSAVTLLEDDREVYGPMSLDPV